MDSFVDHFEKTMDDYDAVDTDVLVVGAGPVGLMAAGELARRGVNTRIIDRAARRSPQSQALVVHARTLEVMDLAGLSDTFVERGYPAPGLNVGLGGSPNDVAVDMRVLDTRYPFMLVLPQRETEGILADALNAYGVEVEWSSSMEGLSQGVEEVTATVRRDSGGYERIHARYVIGCDGAHSTVRKLMNVPFDGKQHTELVLIGDVKADSSFTRTRITNFTGPRGFVSILPFLGDYVRVFAVDFSQQDHGRGEELTLEELQNAVDAISPEHISFSEPTWLTRYIAPSRHVATTRVGRVFLAGDAAHAHSPAGGQGMNTGLQDAANLGWKLAMVLSGHADETLLESYDDERRPVHDRVLEQTDRMFRTFVVRNPLLRLTRRVMAKMLIPRKPIQRTLAENLSGLAVNYRHTQVSRAAADSSTAAVKPGDRIPDLELWAPNRPLVRLYEVLRAPGYTLLLYARGDSVTRDRGALASLINTVTQRSHGWITPYVVLDEGALDENVLGCGVLVDINAEFAKAFGAVHGSMLLIRPDGYLATHEVGFDPTGLAASSRPWASSLAMETARH